MTWHHPTEIEAEELKKKYHEEKQVKGTSNKEKKHSLKKCAGIDVGKPSLQHQSASSEKNADQNLVNNKALTKNKKKLCDKKVNLRLRRKFWSLPRAHKSSALLSRASLTHLILSRRLVRLVNDFLCLL